jgi:ATP-dependent Clp endopeptidase proteolytic subunit ClpP
MSDRALTQLEIDANVSKANAEAASALAEAKSHSAEARKLTAEAQQAELAIVKSRRAEAIELAKDEYHRLYVFDSAVGDASVTTCIHKLAEWSRNDPGCDIEIIFNSPGGSVVAGMALYDYINQIRRKGHKVTTNTLGMAASMAGILLQAGDVRKMGAEAWLLIHEGSFGATGSVGQVEDTVEWVKKIQQRILAIFAAKSTLSAKQIQSRWSRRDWWLSSDEALKLGFIDEIV